MSLPFHTLLAALGAYFPPTNPNVLLMHCDGNLTDEYNGITITPSSGGVAYQAGASGFGQELKWSAAGVLNSPVLASLDPDNGLQIEFVSLYSGGGSNALMFALVRPDGTTYDFGFDVNPGNSQPYRYWVDGHWNTAGINRVADVRQHYVFQIKPGVTSYSVSCAINGVWRFVNVSSSNVASGAHSMRFFGDPAGGLDRHIYDELRVLTGITNFTYTPGTNFTPPTSPFV